MSWKRTLEMELEVAVADALQSGPATPDSALIAERNMRRVLDQWLSQGRMPNIKNYHLRVEGGRGLSVDLRFEEETVVESVNVDVDGFSE